MTNYWLVHIRFVSGEIMFPTTSVAKKIVKAIKVKHDEHNACLDHHLPCGVLATSLLNGYICATKLRRRQKGEKFNN